ncbi:sigma-E processing peptidase SpoIIGA [Salibacterium aidingense]|uniref:sigma-E processing peptidase SpoIIGA n=1 Tax=Salibacterium aidingense TaxID=384933 RepID=UPI0022772B12|nr:sigma-E processing peptidase SpoIIGA [Salibacterium aidingense]
MGSTFSQQDRKEGKTVYYLDLLWGMNVLIHLILLTGTARLTKRSISWKRLWITAVLSSCSIFIVLTPFEGWLVHPAGKFILSVLIVWLGFGFVSLVVFLQQLFMFYVVSFLMAGIIVGMDMMRFSFLEEPAFLKDYASMLYSPLPYLFVLLLLPVIWLIMQGMNAAVKHRSARRGKMAEVTVVLGEYRFKAAALMDTGNQLKDPVTRTSVIVMELQLLKPILARGEFEKWKHMISHQKIEELEKVNKWKNRWKLVPYRTAGHDMKMMFAVKPDYIEVQEDQSTRTEKLDTILLGLDPHSLSSTGDFQMIFPVDALQSSKGNSA